MHLCFSIFLVLIPFRVAGFLNFESLDDRFIQTSDSKSIEPPKEYTHFHSIHSKSIGQGGSGKQFSTDEKNISPIVLEISNQTVIIQTDEKHETYFIPVNVNGQKIPLMLDTGSPYTWIYSNSCNSPSCGNNILYNVSDKDNVSTSSFSLSYSTGDASGTTLTADVEISDIDLNSFEVGLGTSVPDTFNGYKISGILGLPATNSNHFEGLLNKMKEENIISQKIFTICLISSYDDETNLEKQGVISFGTIIEEIQSQNGQIYYTPLANGYSALWAIELKGVFVDDFQVTFKNETAIPVGTDTTTKSKMSRIAIVDSGATLLIIPKIDALTLHSYFEDSKTDGSNFAVLCNSTIELHFSIGGHNWTIPPTSYLGPPYSSSSQYSGYCVSNIQGNNIDDKFTWVLGSVFLKNVYAIFNMENSTFGLSERVNNIIFQNENINSDSTTKTSSSVASVSVSTISNTVINTPNSPIIIATSSSIIASTSTTISSSSSSSPISSKPSSSHNNASMKSGISNSNSTIMKILLMGFYFSFSSFL